MLLIILSLAVWSPDPTSAPDPHVDSSTTDSSAINPPILNSEMEDNIVEALTITAQTGDNTSPTPYNPYNSVALDPEPWPYESSSGPVRTIHDRYSELVSVSFVLLIGVYLIAVLISGLAAFIKRLFGWLFLMKSHDRTGSD